MKAFVGKMTTLLGHLAYLSTIVLLGSLATSNMLLDVKEAAVVVGFLGAWRYSWAGLNFVRAIYFRVWVHPRRKAWAIERFKTANCPSHAFFLVTSYKIDVDVTIPVYRSVLKAAANAKDGATIVASVVDGADERLIRRIYETSPAETGNVNLIIDRIPGTGKRDALARSLRIISRYMPTRNDILVFVDGDSCVPEDLVEQAAPVFTDRSVGALTTDEAVDIPQKGLFRDWFELRFDQRQVMMCSMGLSRRVLTLTGRMSVFRADLATNPGFINMVQADFINHWRLGRVNFLTGDDKSTWFWLMKNGYKLVYLPDVRCTSAETQPKPTFVSSANALMVRWFGNMLRTNGRAIALPVSKIGLFTWWSIVDQRLSIWTTLSGPILAVIAAIFFDPMVLPVYIAWVMLTRYVFVTIISLFRGRVGFPITFPFLLYFSQLYGSIVKSYVFFRLDRQKWTRQASDLEKPKISAGQRILAYSSIYMHALSIGWLSLGLLWLAGLL